MLLLFHQFLRLLAEERGDVSSDASDKELALTNGVDAMSSSMETSPTDYESKKEKQREYEQSCREKLSNPETTPEMKSEEKDLLHNIQQETNVTTSVVEQNHVQTISESNGKPLEEVEMLSYPRKVTVLYELLSACLADTPEDDKKSTRRRKGYDARHRVALRLLATWLDVKWIKMVIFL